MRWMASASVLANAFPEEYGDPAPAGKAGAGPALPRSQASAEDWRPSREMIGGLIEENMELREQLHALLPAS